MALTQINQYLGMEVDATVYTNGGTYHKVIVENNMTGETTTKVFHNRQKAFTYAKTASHQGSTQ